MKNWSSTNWKVSYYWSSTNLKMTDLNLNCLIKNSKMMNCLSYLILMNLKKRMNLNLKRRIGYLNLNYYCYLNLNWRSLNCYSNSTRTDCYLSSNCYSIAKKTSYYCCLNWSYLNSNDLNLTKKTMKNWTKKNCSMTMNWNCWKIWSWKNLNCSMTKNWTNLNYLKNLKMMMTK